MRITFLLPPLSMTGGVRVVAIHARQLMKLGHDVIVVAARSQRPDIRSLYHLVKAGNWWRNNRRDVPFFDDAELEVAHRNSIISGDALRDADIVIATWWETAEWVCALPPSKGRRVHLVQDHEVFEHLPVERAKAVYRLPIPKVVVSKWLSDLLRSEYDAKDVGLVPNAVDACHFNGRPRTKQAVPTFGFLYSQSPRKGISICIEAIEKAKRELQNLRVVSFGSSRPNRNLPLPGWIEFHHNPPQREIPAIYASCDAWLYPSISEGFGLPILEAMACRTPVIGTRAGAGGEYISEATGALVSPNVSDLAEQMKAFAKMEEVEWQAKSRAARARVEGYSWEDAAAKFEGFLRACLS